VGGGVQDTTLFPTGVGNNKIKFHRGSVPRIFKCVFRVYLLALCYNAADRQTDRQTPKHLHIVDATNHRVVRAYPQYLIVSSSGCRTRLHPFQLYHFLIFLLSFFYSFCVGFEASHSSGCACYMLQTLFFLALFFDPEDGGYIFLRNVCWLSNGVISKKILAFFSISFCLFNFSFALYLL
jgi:hypothetical protein